MDISIVVLTYNRKECVRELLQELQQLSSQTREIILVDNASTDGTEALVRREFSDVVYVRNDENLGACGRNRGMAQARGAVVVTLDDDIFGLDASKLDTIARLFADNPSLGALNFRVTDFFTGKTCNWVHHTSPTNALKSFSTYEITEGAVSFRSAALKEVGYYWEKFFIAQEGVDLAFRLMDAGYEVRYDGRLVVKHTHEGQSRASWRFYYFDTRNVIWLAARRMRAGLAAKFLLIGLGSMAVYSIRDGFLRWWLKGIYDGLRDLRSVLRTRRPMLKSTEALVRAIDRDRPSFWVQARKRLFQRANRLDA